MSKANIQDELEIVWLHPPENYSYLREKVLPFNQRRSFPKRWHPVGRQPSSGEHLVAYATIKPSVKWNNGYFYRRYWYVKAYDRWLGRPPHTGDDPYVRNPTHCPMEAVLPSSIKAEHPTVSGCKEDRS